MTETLDGRPRLGEISESGVDEYRPLSGLAVTGLVFGLLSPLAFVGPMLYIFGIVGVVLSVAALVRIGTDSPTISGRKLALAGLILSTFCISSAPAQHLVSRHLLRNEARQFASEWFRFLGNYETHKAHQLGKRPEHRLALDDQLLDAYAKDDALAEDLATFTDNAAVDALLTLGGKAQIRFCETQLQGRYDGLERVDLLYAVSSEEEGQEKTNYVSLRMMRVADAGDGRAGWYINDVNERARPAG